ncbi:MAG: CHAT domain-containing tetratricopeptide repeat protein [Pseudomonadota bacterium]
MAVRCARPLTVLFAWLFAAHAAEAAEPRLIVLEAGVELVEPISTGDLLQVSLDVPRDRAWLIRVTRRGTDMKVAVVSRDETAYSHPVVRYSGDYIYVPAHEIDNFRLHVIADEPNGPPASVAIEAHDAGELPAVVSSVAEWTRSGALAFAEQTMDSRATALEEYRRVERVLYAASDPLLRRIRADAVHAQGEIAYFLEDAVLTTERLREAATQFDALGQPVDQAMALNSLGLWYMDRRQIDAADEAFAAAMRAAQAAGDAIARSMVQYNTCLVPLAAKQLQQAESCLATAVLLADQAADRAFAQSVRYAQAGVYAMRGEAADALPILLEILARIESLDWYLHGTFYNNLALQYARLGDTPQALAYYHKALEVNRQQGRRNTVTLNLRNLGIKYFELGDAERASEFLHSALEMSESIGDSAEAADAEVTLAFFARVQGNLDQSAAYLSAAERRQLDDPDRNGDIAMARTYLSLAEGDIAAAAAQIDLAYEHFSAIEPSFLSQAKLAIAEAEVMRTKGDTDAALSAIDRAIGYYEQLRYPVGIAVGNGKRAEIALARGELADAEQAARTAMNMFRPVRGQLASLDLRANWGEESMAFIDVLIDVAMQRHAAEPTGGHDATALEHAIAARAQTLAETLHSDGPKTGANTELLDRRRDLLLQVSRHADTARSDGSGPPLSDLLLELDQLDQQLASAAPRRASVSGAEIVTAAGVQDALAPNEALLTIYLGDNAGFVWLLGSDGLRSERLRDPDKIADSAVRIARGLRERRDVQRDLAELSAQLLPLLPANDVERLFLSVDGPLSYLPLDLLTIPATTTTLLERFAVVNLPTPAVLTYENGSAADTADIGVDVFVDPTFTASDPRLPNDQRDTPAADTRLGASTLGTQDWNRLAYTAQEAVSIDKRFGSARVRVREGPAANRDAVLQLDGAGAQILHLATHGVVNSERPELTGLMLSRFDPAGQAIDGFVGTRDIYSLQLDASLVVLSACETALGREIRGEGLVGLTRAFMYAGADQVVASLWQVSDSATAYLMDAFYAAYLESFDAAAALQQAKQAVRSQRRWRDPYYWSGFVLYGVR